MPSAPKQRKIAIVGSRSVGMASYLFDNRLLVRSHHVY